MKRDDDSTNKRREIKSLMKSREKVKKATEEKLDGVKLCKLKLLIDTYSTWMLSEFWKKFVLLKEFCIPYSLSLTKLILFNMLMRTMPYSLLYYQLSDSRAKQQLYNTSINRHFVGSSQALFLLFSLSYCKNVLLYCSIRRSLHHFI